MEINGLDALQKQLKKNADMSLVKEAVKLNATELHKNAMRDVPVDTGTLKRSLMLSMHDTGYTWRIRALVNYAACSHRPMRWLNNVKDLVKNGGNLITEPFFRGWNMI